MSKFTKADKKKLDAEMKVVKHNDLYNALHYVGDDPVKSEIDDNLIHLLTPEAYRLVVAVFNLSTDWKTEKGRYDSIRKKHGL